MINMVILFIYIDDYFIYVILFVLFYKKYQ